jgi:hypothetical protein
MKAMLISLISALGAALASAASVGCLTLWIDEPTMPKSMLEK